MFPVNDALVYKSVFILQKELEHLKASTLQAVILKQPAHSVSFVKVKPLPSLQLLSCHDHVDKLMFMLLQHPFMV